MEEGHEGDEDTRDIEGHGKVQDGGRSGREKRNAAGLPHSFSASAHGNVDLLCAVSLLSFNMVSSDSL